MIFILIVRAFGNTKNQRQAITTDVRQVIRHKETSSGSLDKAEKYREEGTTE